MHLLFYKHKTSNSHPHQTHTLFGNNASPPALRADPSPLACRGGQCVINREICAYVNGLMG
jgi:hypothetical protein